MKASFAHRLMPFAIPVAAGLATGGAACAAAPSVDDLFSIRVQQSANTDNFATGDFMIWGANTVIPADSSYGVTRQCPPGLECTNVNDPDFVKQSLFFREQTLRPTQFFASRPRENSDHLTGPWILAISSTANFAPGTFTLVNTPAIGNIAKMPFVEQMSASGTGVTPTISWQLPSTGLSVDTIRLRIFDRSPANLVTTRSVDPFVPPRSFKQSDFIYEQILPGTATNHTLPASWPIDGKPDRSLILNNHYSIHITLDHERSPGSPISRSVSIFDFTPIDIPGIPKIALPNATPVRTTAELTGTGQVPYQFSQVPASPTEISYIDPVVATGFTYAIGSGDPNFKSVLIPAKYGDGFYNVMVWNGSGWSTAKSDLGVNEAFDFSLNGYLDGVDKFRIVGIETSAEVSPLDITGFVTGLTFMKTGTFNGTMQAIVFDTAAPVPEPETWLMLLSGMGLIGLRARRLRRQAKP